MRVTPEMYRGRWTEFSEPIKALANSDIVVHKIITAYAAGLILTRDEALSQMVVHLANGNAELRNRLIDYIQRSTTPIIC